MRRASISPMAWRASAVWLPLLLMIIALASFLAPGTGLTQDRRSLRFPRVEIDAVIGPEGSLAVREEREFAFRGQFTEGWMAIPLPQGTVMRDIVVSEGGRTFNLVEPGDSHPPGSYFFEQRGSRMHINWFYTADNENRTFIVEYIIDHAVIVYEDTAELYWQFIGDESDVATERALVNVILPPYPGVDDQVMAWAHGPLYGVVSLPEKDRVRFVIDDLPPRTHLEGRVLFSPARVPRAENIIQRPAREAIMEEEAQLARLANRKRFLLRADFIAAFALLVFIPLGFFVNRYRSRRHPEAYRGEYFRDLPGEYSPAEAGFLYNSGRVGPEMFTATVLDLVRRGHFRLEEYRGEEGWLMRRTYTDYRLLPDNPRDFLSGHEQLLYHFLFVEVGRRGAEGVTLRELGRYGKRRRENAAHFYRRWTESIKESVDKLRFFQKTRWAGLFLGLALFLAGLVMIWVGMEYAGVVALLGGPFLAAGLTMTRSYSPYGADQLARWQAFRKFLLHFSRLDRSVIPQMAIWEHYLVYATALGVAEKVMEQLRLVYPNLQHESSRFFCPSFAMFATNPASFHSLGSSMGSSFRAAFGSSSSSTGGGGGFSGGGGGGGGGGGVGAR